MYPAIIISVVLILIIAFVIIKRLRRNARRNMLLAQPMPEEHIKIIEKNIPLFNKLPDVLKMQLLGLVNVFLDEKDFIGCEDLEMTDEIKLTIAAQACILLLNRPAGYFPKLRTIYVYPHTYTAPTASADGIAGGRSARLGESWQHGPVVLAWNSVTGGARNIHDGKNVVMHEFAHQLDQMDGEADGAPILESRSSYITWAKVLGAEFETLQKKSKKYRRSVINRYGATNPAEFFAVATEAFFERSKKLKEKHPELYEELKSYYKIDPNEWNTL